MLASPSQVQPNPYSSLFKQEPAISGIYKLIPTLLLQAHFQISKSHALT